MDLNQDALWNEEQQRVDQVTAAIADRIGQLGAETGEIRTDVVSIRKHFWDDVSVDLSSSDDLAETYSSMRQQSEVLSERERRYRHAAALLDKFRRMQPSPYFGRIDFRGEGDDATECIYLGIASFQAEEFGPYLVYDWRAPVSSLYYDHSPGPAQYETPGGIVRGDMELKRQYMIREGKLHAMFDTGVTIGDELLQQVLSRNSDARMKSIVATIQKEQNRLIRNDRSRMLIVQGAAGSGKTSAALQRVAYLLYKHRETLQADQIVLFSPNPMFNSYVSTVLPELGEKNMQQTTFMEYAEHRLGAEFQLEDPFDQLESILASEGSSEDRARLAGIRFKSMAEYVKAILAYRDCLLQEGMRFRALSFRGREVVSEERMKARFYGYDDAVRVPNRMELMRGWLLEELDWFAESELERDWVDEEIELLEPDDYHHAYRQLRKAKGGSGATFDDFDKERNILGRMLVARELEPLRKMARRLHYIDVPGLYRQLYEDGGILARIREGTGLELPEEWSEICRQTLQKLEQGVLAYEDVAPYLLLQELLKGFEVNVSIRHVFVDEVQDYSPFQLEYLKRLFPRSRMTALGDLNQAIYSHASSLTELAALEQLYGADQTEIIRLTRSYRSTREIVNFTRGMLPGGKEIEPFDRAGEKPMVTVARDRCELHNKLGGALAELHAEGCESIAIICLTASESAAAYASLSERLPRLGVKLVTKNTPAYEKGISVLPVYLAKGVEFDAVLIYDGSQERYSRDSDAKLLYTACTRAMHLLRIYSLGEPSPFIAAQPTSAYTLG